MRNLEDLRGEIDKVDTGLRNLFIERMKLAHEIALVKKASGDEVYKPEREKAVIERGSLLVDEEYREAYIEFLKKTIEISRNYQLEIIASDNE